MPLLGVEEASRALGVSVSTVWRMIRRGEIKSVRRRGRRLIADIHSHNVVRDAEAIPPLKSDSPIFAFVGAGRSGGSGAGARDKHAVLARVVDRR